MKANYRKFKILLITLLSIGLVGSLYFIGGGKAEIKEVLVSTINDTQSLDDEDYMGYLKKIWIGEGYDVNDGYLYPISFYITKIDNGMFEGGAYIGGIRTPDFYYYRFSPTALTIKGRIDNGIAYGQFDESGNEGSITIKFKDLNRIEATVKFTEISYSDPNQFVAERKSYSSLSYKDIDGTYLYRPYNLDDIKILIQPDKEQVFDAELNSWGKVHLVTEMTNSNKPHPDVYLTDVHNNILYLFHAPFQTASKITDVTVKDLNGDGLKDVQVTNTIENYTFEWIFYQMGNGLFYDSGIFERENVKP